MQIKIFFHGKNHVKSFMKVQINLHKVVIKIVGNAIIKQKLKINVFIHAMPLIICSVMDIFNEV